MRALFISIGLLGLIILAVGLFQQTRVKGRFAQKTPVVSLSGRVKPLPIGTLPTSRSLALKVHSSTECQLGELDGLDIDQHYFPGRPLKMTIESLEEKNGKPLFQRSISVQEIDHGIEINLTLPEGQSMFGVFICSDGGGVESCKEKVPLNASTIIMQATLKSDEAKTDRVYYFQPILVMGKELRLPIVPLTTRELAGIYSGPSDNLPVLAASSSALSILNPAPATFIGNTIDLSLSRHRGVVCDE